MGPLTPRTDGSWQASGDPGLPALVGLWRPRIVVGPAFDQQFSAQEQGLILQHERNHRRNGDHWANGALLLARVVFWFHPLLPWAARRFLRDQELACDARTIGPQPALRGLYASTLLKAQLVHPVAPAVCHWRSQPVLKERIAMLKQSSGRHCRGCPGRCWWSGCVWAWGRWHGPARAVRPVAPGSVSSRSNMRRTMRPRWGWTGRSVDKMPPPSYPKSAVEQRRRRGQSAHRSGCTGPSDRCAGTQCDQSGVFDAVSVAAARSWTYRPAVKNGKPVAGAVRIPITYAMDDTEDAK